MVGPAFARWLRLSLGQKPRRDQLHRHHGNRRLLEQASPVSSGSVRAVGQRLLRDVAVAHEGISTGAPSVECPWLWAWQLQLHQPATGVATDNSFLWQSCLSPQELFGRHESGTHHYFSIALTVARCGALRILP